MEKTTLPNGIAVAEINAYETKFLYEEIFVQEVYGRYDIQIPPGGVVIDIGANIGLFSIYFAERHPDARFVCVEPAPHCLERLTHNLARYGDRVTIVAKGIGDRQTNAKFSFYPNYSIMSGLFADTAQDRGVLVAGVTTQYKQRFGVAPGERELEFLIGTKLDDVQHFDCPIITLSQLIKDKELDRIALVKIDVERAENLILAGIQERDWQQIDQIVVEVHDQGNHEHEAMQALLEKHGFKTKIFTEPMLVNSDIYVISASRL